MKEHDALDRFLDLDGVPGRTPDVAFWFLVDFDFWRQPGRLNPPGGFVPRRGRDRVYARRERERERKKERTSEREREREGFVFGVKDSGFEIWCLGLRVWG